MRKSFSPKYCDPDRSLPFPEGMAGGVEGPPFVLDSRANKGRPESAGLSVFDEEEFSLPTGATSPLNRDQS